MKEMLVERQLDQARREYFKREDWKPFCHGCGRELGSFAEIVKVGGVLCPAVNSMKLVMIMIEWL